MVEPKTRLSDYLEYRKDVDALENAHVAGKIDAKAFLAESDALLKRYEGRVFPDDSHTFDSFKEYAGFLAIECAGNPSIIELLAHEHAHGVEFERKGLKFKYGCTVLINNVPDMGGDPGSADQRTIDPFVVVENVPLDDVRDALRTPDNLSDRDRKLGDLI